MGISQPFSGPVHFDRCGNDELGPPWYLCALYVGVPFCLATFCVVGGVVGSVIVWGTEVFGPP